MNRPQLYLDIDGVLIAPQPAFDTVLVNSNYDLERYSPEVVRRLGNTGLELTWLTTWEDDALKFAGSINALKNGRVLDLPKNKKSSILRKSEALIKDQICRPTPFVWVDDQITSGISETVKDSVSLPHLIIKPDGSTGITEQDLDQIDAFVAATV